MLTDEHDPGADAARERALAAAAFDGAPLSLGGSMVRIGTAGWTDPTLVAPGVFYPAGASSAEARLRYYSSRFPLVEVDSCYYALPARRSAELWVERTPPGFVFDIKAYALMTGHPTEVSRLPKAIHDALPPELAAKRRIQAADLPAELDAAVWAWFRDALEPLAAAGKLGAVLLQYPPWFRPTRANSERLCEAKRRLDPYPVSVEFRHRSWLEGRIGERTLEFLAEHGLPFVMVDEPQGTDHSVRPVVAVTVPRLATIRCHGRRAGVWDRPGVSVAERFRYLYSAEELNDLARMVNDAAHEARELHVVFNNCYANYGTTNALELGALLAGGDLR